MDEKSLVPMTTGVRTVPKESGELTLITLTNSYNLGSGLQYTNTPGTCCVEEDTFKKNPWVGK